MKLPKPVPPEPIKRLSDLGDRMECFTSRNEAGKPTVKRWLTELRAIES